MHSSGMSTTHLLTIFQHALGWGVYPSMYWAGWLYPRMHWVVGVCPGGVSGQRGCLPRGVSAWGVCPGACLPGRGSRFYRCLSVHRGCLPLVLGGCLPRGGVCLEVADTHLRPEADTSPPPWTDRHLANFVCGR